MKHILVFLLLVLFVSNAYAAPRKQRRDLYVVSLFDRGLRGGCNSDVYYDIIEGVARQVKPAMRLRVYGSAHPHPFPFLQSYANREQLFQAIRLYAKQDHYLRDKRVHFLIPPLVNTGGRLDLGGGAGPVCEPSGVTISTCSEFNELGQPRTNASILYMAHEILHGMGAQFIDGYNIMNTGAFPDNIETDRLPIKKKTVKQIKRCRVN